MRRALSVIVLNEHGVLSRVVGLFSGRGYNIESLTVAPIPDSKFSRISIITRGDEAVFEQISKQLHKLITTYKVFDEVDFVERECAMVKISTDTNLAGLDSLLKGYNGIIAHSDDTHIIVSVCDTCERVENFIKTMQKFHPLDTSRSGALLMER